MLMLLKDFKGDVYLVGENVAKIAYAFDTKLSSKLLKFWYEKGWVYVKSVTGDHCRLYEWDMGSISYRSMASEPDFMERIFRLFLENDILIETVSEEGEYDYTQHVKVSFNHPYKKLFDKVRKLKYSEGISGYIELIWTRDDSLYFNYKAHSYIESKHCVEWEFGRQLNKKIIVTASTGSSQFICNIPFRKPKTMNLVKVTIPRLKKAFREWVVGANMYCEFVVYLNPKDYKRILEENPNSNKKELEVDYEERFTFDSPFSVEIKKRSSIEEGRILFEAK